MLISLKSAIWSKNTKNHTHKYINLLPSYTNHHHISPCVTTHKTYCYHFVRCGLQTERDRKDPEHHAMQVMNDTKEVSQADRHQCDTQSERAPEGLPFDIQNNINSAFKIKSITLKSYIIAEFILSRMVEENILQQDFEIN